MKHPSSYTTVSFLGLHIMVVEAGTKITNECSGETAIISDSEAAKKGSTIFCTQKVFDRMKREIQ
jgi:hypothetical protein